MKIIITDKIKAPYCKATSEKCIYCAVRRGLNSKNPDDYVLYMHPRFVCKISDYTRSYILKNVESVECTNSYEVIIKDDIISSFSKHELEEQLMLDTRMSNICFLLLIGCAEKLADNKIKMIVNSIAIDSLFPYKLIENMDDIIGGMPR
jgi:hypothetical protein